MITKNDLSYLEEEVMSNFKHLHENPELGFLEVNTSKFLIDKLKEYGIEYKQVAITGIIATIYGDNPGKTIAIRADIDALPITEESGVPYASKKDGVMHACGHDGHMSVLLGAARYLQEHKNLLNGNVRIIFQPGEEGMTPETKQMLVDAGASPLGGAASMVQAGALEGVDGFFALHIFPEVPEGGLTVCRDKAMASCDKLEVTIQGKGGHGSAPDTAIDPTGALSSVIAAFNQLPSRELSALDNCVITIGTVSTDSAWNIIPDKFDLTCSVRTYDEKIREYVFDRLPEIAENIAKAHRCTATCVRTKMAIPTINSPIMSQRMVEVGKKVLGEDKSILTDRPLVCSEDVAYFLNTVEGAMGFLSGMDPDCENYAAHNPKYRLNPKALMNGILFEVNMAIEYLNEK